MKTYNSFIMFLSDLMFIEMPEIFYCHQGKYYDMFGHDCEPFEIDPAHQVYIVVDENRIYMNLDSDYDELDLYLEMAHMVRHSGQYQATIQVGFKDIADPYMICQWAKEFSICNTCSADASREVEKDAAAFTWFIGKAIFNVNIAVDYENDVIRPYKKNIINSYTLKEIKDCYEYSGHTFPIYKA